MSYSRDSITANKPANHLSLLVYFLFCCFKIVYPPNKIWCLLSEILSRPTEKKILTEPLASATPVTVQFSLPSDPAGFVSLSIALEISAADCDSCPETGKYFQKDANESLACIYYIIKY
jgi:hypothetical protein